MANTKELLGKRIRSLRRMADLSQEQLAEKAGLSYKYLGEVERGKANVTVDILEKVATALDVEMMDLFDYEHELEGKKLKQKVNAFVREANEKDLKAVYRIMKAIVK